LKYSQCLGNTGGGWVVIYFLVTGLGVWISSQPFARSDKDSGPVTLLHFKRKRLSAEAIAVDRHIHYEDICIYNLEQLLALL
jgi:hypothetical protein